LPILFAPITCFAINDYSQKLLLSQDFLTGFVNPPVSQTWFRGMLKWSGFDDQPQFLTSCYLAKKVLTGAAYRGTVKTFSGFLA